jgi:hypothetical protein
MPRYIPREVSPFARLGSPSLLPWYSRLYPVPDGAYPLDRQGGINDLLLTGGGVIVALDHSGLRRPLVWTTKNG